MAGKSLRWSAMTAIAHAHLFFGHNAWQREDLYNPMVTLD
jgi:hypothetical protein